MNNLILCGFMGSGKTAVGKALAAQYGMELIDTDSLIEKNENRTIAEIFANSGEPYFRGLETKLIKELATKKNLVISLGGGLAANRENHPYLKNLGKVILLDCGIEETLKRIEGDKTRPLTANGRQDIINRYNFRKPIYEEVADITVDSSADVQRTLNLIISLL
ncbi:MAG: shikimate kinase [Clostridia bacterium]|nr:shikimate kinase [Clostridia bacterium]